ncbi:hypothetical protein N7501_000232 [Penicillium viridicatum]|nr:hypothetical protein N7501_000232 [Penicillium viridicatum]
MPFGVSYLELLGHSLIFALLAYARGVARSRSWSLIFLFVLFFATSSLTPLYLLFSMHKKDDKPRWGTEIYRTRGISCPHLAIPTSLTQVAKPT